MSTYFTPPAVVVNGTTAQADDVNDLSVATAAAFDTLAGTGIAGPAITAGDAYKALQVNAGETATEYVTTLRVDIAAADGTQVLSNGTNGSDASFTGNVTGNVIGSIVGDVYASNGISKILESGTDGSNAVFTGSVTGDVTGDVTGSATKVGGLNVKVIDIGDWDMTTATGTVSTTVAHGLTYSKIRSPISVTIRNDGDTLLADLTNDNTLDSSTRGIQINSTSVILLRGTGGAFDGGGYQTTPYNRGWVTIWYVD